MVTKFQTNPHFLYYIFALNFITACDCAQVTTRSNARFSFEANNAMSEAIEPTYNECVAIIDITLLMRDVHYANM